MFIEEDILPKLGKIHLLKNVITGRPFMLVVLILCCRSAIMQLVSCVNLQLGSGVPAEDYCKIHLKVSRFNESVDLVSAILYDNNVYKCAWTVADEEESEDTLSIQWIRFSQQRKIPVHRFFLFLYRERDTVSMDTFNCVDPDNIFIMIQSGKSLRV